MTVFSLGLWQLMSPLCVYARNVSQIYPYYECVFPCYVAAYVPTLYMQGMYPKFIHVMSVYSLAM